MHRSYYIVYNGSAGEFDIPAKAISFLRGGKLAMAGLLDPSCLLANINRTMAI